jgi:hypothetical protein
MKAEYHKRPNGEDCIRIDCSAPEGRTVVVTKPEEWTEVARVRIGKKLRGGSSSVWHMYELIETLQVF